MTIGPIHWGSYPGDLLERVMAVLLFQERPTAWRRTASQGDAGIDVAEPIADGYRIFQIKGFTGRMSGNRPRQVKESLKRAIKEPRLDGPIARWNLVVPIDPTSEEEKWFASSRHTRPSHVNGWARSSGILRLRSTHTLLITTFRMERPA